MINENIPVEIIERIIAKEEERSEYDLNRTRWYSYFEINARELCVSTVAAKNSNKSIKQKKPTLYLKKIAITAISGTVYFCDVHYYYCSGYLTLWGEELKQSIKPGGIVTGIYSENVWHCGLSNSIKIYKYAEFLNYEYLNETEYKYCAYDGTADLISYLNAYKANPRIEFISKICSCWYALKKQVVRLAGKDRQFVRFLQENSEYIKQSVKRANAIPVEVLISAYKHKTSIEYELSFYGVKKRLRYGGLTEKRILSIVGGLSENKKRKFFRYLVVNGVENYIDYAGAAIDCNISLCEEKNLIPHNFMYWHDLRINESAQRAAEKDENARREFYCAFKAVSEDYEQMEFTGKKYIALIARTPAELVREGKILHHCVGGYGYAEKFVKEQTLIFFIRESSAPTMPYVTAEIGLKSGRLMQCYGIRDTTPNNEVMAFVKEIWLPYALFNLEMIRKEKRK